MGSGDSMFYDTTSLSDCNKRLIHDSLSATTRWQYDWSALACAPTATPSAAPTAPSASPTSTPTTTVVSGCTYANATNYNASAHTDDGSCSFELYLLRRGCTYAIATNFDPLAELDDRSCVFHPSPSTPPPPSPPAVPPPPVAPGSCTNTCGTSGNGAAIELCRHHVDLAPLELMSSHAHSSSLASRCFQARATTAAGAPRATPARSAPIAPTAACGCTSRRCRQCRLRRSCRFHPAPRRRRRRRHRPSTGRPLRRPRTCT